MAIRAACDAAHPISVNGERIANSILEPGDTIELGAHSPVLIFDVRVEDDLLGREVSGYRIESWLGEGGVGAVYEATQLSLDRTVAIKFLAPRLATDQKFVDRFLDEAQSMARLSHSNVVAIHDVVHEDEIIFFSMEYLPGGTVGDRLREEKTLSPADALRTGLDALQALAWAEELGIVHRDIKPDNLLIAPDGAVKVADLGLATQIDAEFEGDSGRWVGSPRFMAPEQAQGKAVDSRADVYALGCTLFLCLTGKYPIDGATMQEIFKRKNSVDPPPLEDFCPDIPAAIAKTVGTMIARNLEDRFASCEDALTALRAAKAELDGGPAAASTPATPRPAVPVESQVTLEVRQKRRSEEARRSLKTKIAAAWVGAVLSLGLVGATFYESSPYEGPSSVGRSTGGQTPLTVAQLEPKSTPEAGQQTPPKNSAASGNATKKEKTGVSEVTRQKKPVSPPKMDAALRLALDEQIPAFLEAKNYRAAKSLLDDLEDEHPTQSAEISRALNKVLAGAQKYWKERDDESDLVAGQGDIDRAKKILKEAADNLPEKNFATFYREKTATFDARSEATERCKEKLSELERDFASALSKRDFVRAEKVVKRLSSPPACRSAQGVAEGVARRAQSRLEAVQEAWKQIGSGIDQAIKKKSRLSVARGERPIDSQRSYTIERFNARNATIELKEPARESLNVFALSTRTLRNFVGGESGKSKADDSRTREALGLLLLYHDHPFRARELLLDKKISDDEKQRHTESLESAEDALITETTKRLAGWRKSLDDPKSPDNLAARLQSRAESLFHRFSETPKFDEISEDIKDLYVAARTKILSRGDLPDGLFRGTVLSYKNGLIRLKYKFSSRDQIRDFVRKLRQSSQLEVLGKEGANLRGEYRFECGGGDIFRGELRVSGRIPADGYNENSPNVNVALWTSEEDRVTPTGEQRSRRRKARTRSDYFVFGIGFDSEEVAARESVIAPDGRGRIAMPADVFLSGSRPDSLHSDPKDECLWAQRHRDLRGAKLSFDVSMDSKTASFSINNSKQYLGRGKRMKRVAPSAPFVGSFSIFTNGEVVLLTSITISGKLNPDWVGKHVREDALGDFEEFASKAAR